jgi:hypothetical protein
VSRLRLPHHNVGLNVCNLLIPYYILVRVRLDITLPSFRCERIKPEIASIARKCRKAQLRCIRTEESDRAPPPTTLVFAPLLARSVACSAGSRPPLAKRELDLFETMPGSPMAMVAQWVKHRDSAAAAAAEQRNRTEPPSSL